MRKSVLFNHDAVCCQHGGKCTEVCTDRYGIYHEEYPAVKALMSKCKKLRRKYQSEVEALAKEAQKMFQDYQAKSSTLSAAQKTKTEDAIVAKEKAAAELKRNYFGPKAN